MKKVIEKTFVKEGKRNHVIVTRVAPKTGAHFFKIKHGVAKANGRKSCKIVEVGTLDSARAYIDAI